jgi:hypothetical protein
MTKLANTDQRGEGILEQTRNYYAAIFLKHIFIQHSMKIDDNTWVIKAKNGFSCLDSLQYMKAYSEEWNGKQFPLPVDKISNNYSTHDPVCVIQLYDIVAPDFKTATSKALKTAYPIIGFLRWHQDEMAEVFGTVIGDGERCIVEPFPKYFTGMKTYLGEDVQKFCQYTAKKMETDQKLALYLTLYADAISEETLDFRIVKLWSLLEVMAFPVKEKRDSKESGVRKLIDKYRVSIEKFGEYDLVTLAYKHRNSIVHEGTANPAYVSSEFRKWVIITNPILQKLVKELQSMTNFLIRRYLATLET